MTTFSPARCSVNEILTELSGEIHGLDWHSTSILIPEALELSPNPKILEPCTTISSATAKATSSFELVTNPRADSLARVLRTSCASLDEAKEFKKMKRGMKSGIASKTNSTEALPRSSSRKTFSDVRIQPIIVDSQ